MAQRARKYREIKKGVKAFMNEYLKKDTLPFLRWGGLRLDTNRLNTSHSQRLNSGKLLGTGRCGWWCPIDPCPNEPRCMQKRKTYSKMRLF